MNVIPLKKISPATVDASKLVRLDVANAPTEVVLYDVYGVIAKTKSGCTDKGEWLAFIGEIEAVTSDGVVYCSTKVFLQQPLEDMLFTALMRAQENDPGATVKFAARVSIVPPKSGKPSMTGYEYKIVPLMRAEDSSPMQDLRKLAQQQVALLSAPKDEVEATSKKK